MITDKQIKIIRKKLDESIRPIYFFDDDPDGVSSFVMLYKYKSKGKGICVKGKPMLESRYALKVQEFGADKVFILDKPLLEQEFIRKVNTEIIWIDHHPVQDNKGVHYFNPRIKDDKDNRPTSYWVYQVVKDKHPELLWLAMIGIVGDWNLLLAEEFRKKYPDLLPKKITKPDDALFNTELGKLIRIITFNLKGSTSEVMNSVKVLTRINDPYEILNGTSSKGKYLIKKYHKINSKYEELIKQVKVDKGEFLIFKYKDNNLAISSELSNELLHLYPNKIIIVIREKGDELMMSLRSSKKNIITPLKEALKKTTGYGGGHDLACGANIKTHEYDAFIKALEQHIKRQK